MQGAKPHSEAWWEWSHFRARKISTVRVTGNDNGKWDGKSVGGGPNPRIRTFKDFLL